MLQNENIITGHRPQRENSLPTGSKRTRGNECLEFFIALEFTRSRECYTEYFINHTVA